MTESVAFCRAINANPRDRAPQLVYADWLAERGDRRESFWRCVGIGGLGGLVGIGGLGGLVGIGGRVGRVGLGGRVGRVGLGGRGGRVGIGGRVGRVGLGGLVGRGGLVGIGSPFHPEAPIVLIPGENVMVFLSDGYYVSVVIGHVAQEMPHGWIVDPCREVLSIGDNDTLIELALGKKRGVRDRCKLSDRITDGFRVPLGVSSIVWHGELPE